MVVPATLLFFSGFLMAGSIRDYHWVYNGTTYSIRFILYPEVYQSFRERDRAPEYDLYASDVRGRKFIGELTKELRSYARRSGLSETEIPHFIISFVQHLPYTSDDVTTEFDEYPRFPYETIYDDGGDCEDTSILAAALLHDLGYGVSLLSFPGHVAVGVKCNPRAGEVYYSYDETDYCYLETTGENWDIGKVPPNVQAHAAVVTPLVERPAVEVDFTSNYHYDSSDTYVDVDVTVINVGSKSADGMTIYVALQSLDTSKVWSHVESSAMRLEPGATARTQVANLHVNTGEPFRIYVRAAGEGMIPDDAVSDWIDLR